MLLTDSSGISCTFAVQLPSPFPGILMVTDRQPSITLQSPSMNHQCHDYMLHFIFTSLVLCVGVIFSVVIYLPVRVNFNNLPPRPHECYRKIVNEYVHKVHSRLKLSLFSSEVKVIAWPVVGYVYSFH